MVRRKLGDVGRRIGLIRWTHEGGEWVPETVVGIVVEHSGGVWHLDVNKNVRALNKSDWSVYHP
jgi:hypothetical protein